MNYEHAMSQAAVGFRVTRKDWVNKNVTTSDGNDFKPVVTELAESDAVARKEKLEGMSEEQLHKGAKKAKVAYSESDTKEELVAKILAASSGEPQEDKVSTYSATDEDKAANDWSVL